ncbi:hypothetical protein KL938_004800 [Ogataea parapolymorpha]|nr:hypothetical protein KL938_004800 [Ogataea parapolymorpha]
MITVCIQSDKNVDFSPPVTVYAQTPSGSSMAAATTCMPVITLMAWHPPSNSIAEIMTLVPMPTVPRPGPGRYDGRGDKAGLDVPGRGGEVLRVLHLAGVFFQCLGDADHEGGENGSQSQNVAVSVSLFENWLNHCSLVAQRGSQLGFLNSILEALVVADNKPNLVLAHFASVISRACSLINSDLSRAGGLSGFVLSFCYC